MLVNLKEFGYNFSFNSKDLTSVDIQEYEGDPSKAYNDGHGGDEWWLHFDDAPQTIIIITVGGQKKQFEFEYLDYKPYKSLSLFALSKPSWIKKGRKDPKSKKLYDLLINILKKK